MKQSLLKAVLAMACAACMAGTAAAQDLKLLSSWDKNYAYNPYLLDPFIDGVQKKSDGRIKIQVSGPETVPPFEQLEPTGSGVFDLLFTHGSYHFGTSPAMTVVEALDADLTAVRESGLFDYLDKHYQKYNLKLVMLPVSPAGAYHIVLREPVSPAGDLAGRKIRGVATYGGVLKMLNAVATVLPVSEVYTGLEKGLIDGTSWPIIGALDYRWYEVAKYLLRPGFGVNYEPLFMNLDAWNRLSKQDQQVMQEVARSVEDAWVKNALTAWKAEEAKLLQHGMTITEMGPEQKKKLSAAWAEGLWAQGVTKNAKLMEDMQGFLRKKGLLK